MYPLLKLFCRCINFSKWFRWTIE